MMLVFQILPCVLQEVMKSLHFSTYVYINNSQYLPKPENPAARGQPMMLLFLPIMLCCSALKILYLLCSRIRIRYMVHNRGIPWLPHGTLSLRWLTQGRKDLI